MITKFFFICCISLQTMNGMHYIGAEKQVLYSIGRSGNVVAFKDRLKKTSLSPGSLADVIEELRHMQIENENPMIALLHRSYKKSHPKTKNTLSA